MFIIPFFVLFFSGAIGFLTTPYMGLATLAYGCLCLGMATRKTNRLMHIRYMVAGVLIDLGVVVTLEFQRSAVEKALEAAMTLPQMLHIAFSLAAVLLYIPVMWMGWSVWKRTRPPINQQMRPWHKNLGILAFLCRTLGFLLMFSLLSVVKD